MSTILQYRVLFSVQVLIDFYLTEEAGLYQNTTANPMTNVLEEQYNRYNLLNELKISPTPECNILLKDNRLIFKRNSRGFVIACQVTQLADGSFIPFVPLNDLLRLRFVVVLENQNFYNFTNIRMEKNLVNKDQFLYYFSNRANNNVNNILYLSEEISDFNDLYAYEASEIFIDISDPFNPIMQEAVEDNGPGLFNANQWREIFPNQNPHFQFVTASDRVVSRPTIFKYNVESAALETIVFVIRNPSGFIVKTINFQTTQTGTPLFECELKLSDLNPGLYNLEVQDNSGSVLSSLSLTFYLDDQLFQQRLFALIECFHEPSGSLNEYRWLDQNNDNRLLSPEYTIRWKNRATSWRYYYETAPDFSSIDVENLDANPVNPNHRILISVEPLALTQIGREVEITLNNGELVLLPNPGVDLVYPENGRIFSEINLGGGFGPPA